MFSLSEFYILWNVPFIYYVLQHIVGLRGIKSMIGRLSPLSVGINMLMIQRLSTACGYLANALGIQRITAFLCLVPWQGKALYQGLIPKRVA